MGYINNERHQPINFEQLSENIVIMRSCRGYTQKVLALKSSVSESHIKVIEKNSSKMSFPTLEAISKALNVKSINLIEGSRVKLTNKNSGDVFK